MPRAVYRQLQAVSDSDLPIYPREVVLHRLFLKAKLRGNLLVGATAHHQPKKSLLVVRQAHSGKLDWP